MTARFVWCGAAVVLLTALTLAFPGHTLLQSDTQIYLPILEHLRDRSVLANDAVAVRPHVSFTIYDEVALAASRVTGASLDTILTAQQVAFRALGILGILLAATALGLRDRMAVLVAAAFSLGAAVAGPSILTLEFEPVPRGFAVPLLLLAMGLAAHDRDALAGIAASLAFLYHPPSVATFWAVYFLLALWPSKPQIMSRRIAGLAPLLAGVLVMLVFSRWQAGVSEVQPFLGTISPELERLQRLRASYNWVSTWPASLIVLYGCLTAAAFGAFWRLRKRTPEDLEFFLIGLPVFGMLTVPASYLLLERLKWVVAPQIQPARGLVFVVAICILLAAVAGLTAASRRRWPESLAWLTLVYSIPLTMTLTGFRPEPARFAGAFLLAGLTAFAAWADAAQHRWSIVPVGAAALLPFLVVPALAGRAAQDLHTPELRQVCEWARAATPGSAVFLWPDAGKGVEPGIFRARALRPVYVDWKGGGQVNFLPRFAREWWERWQRTGAGRFKRWHVPAYSRWGIDYFVLKQANRLPDRTPVYQNAAYAVYATR